MNFDKKCRNGCPCDGCTEETGRHPGCHSKCEDRYIPWRKALDARNEAERSINQSNDTMSYDGKRKMWRSKRYSKQVRYNKSTKAD